VTRAFVLIVAAALAACSTPQGRVPDEKGLSAAELSAYRDAAAALDAGDPVRALRVVAPVTAREPWHVPAHALRQDALAMSAGGEADARRWYAAEAARRPDDPARALLAARVAPREGGAREAAYRTAAADPRTATWARIALAYELVRRGRDDAERAARLVDEGFALDAEAALKSRSSAEAEAERIARAVADEHPDLAAAQAAFADVLLAVSSDVTRKLAPEALRAAEAALELEPESAAAWARAGRARRVMADDEGAATAFAKAASLAPRNAVHRANLGRVLLDLRRDAEAKDALAAAAALDPADAATAVNHAVALFRTRNLAAAEREFVRASRLDPADPRPLDGLALTRAERGDRAGAAEAMERYLAVGGTDRDAARRFIDKMRGTSDEPR
jgi:Tfp pilus assembly protein PilF